MEATTKPSADQIEKELGELLDQERFEPPAGFRDKALVGAVSDNAETTLPLARALFGRWLEQIVRVPQQTLG